MNRTLLLASVIAVFCSCGKIADKTLNVEAVITQAGIVAGKTSTGGDVAIFLGIPYAAPPVGDLRWKAPQAVEVWEGVRECVNPPASAMQPDPKPFFCWSQEFITPAKPMSEDCLYLNIWTPAKKADEKLPVMVWIHGGGLTSGSGMVPLYDGTEMARKGIVFITINYRLGIFGFLAHPELSKESDLNTSGNYGILDQIAALKWVKNNIAAFGGNPENVTIAGQSAGSFSVNMLMVSPLAKGLFQKAIGESGGMFGKTLSLGNTLADAEKAGETLFADAGYSDLEAMRVISVDSLLSKFPGRQGITVDNIVVPPVAETFEAGKQNDVPLISGWNADDGVFFGPAPTAEQAKTAALARYGEQADAYLQLFPANTDEEAASSQKLSSQISFGWNNYSWARLQSETGQNPSYLYYFNRVPPGEPNYGAFHSAEFAYALHTLHNWDKPFIETDYELENIMSSYWINFAKTGNPNGTGLPQWPAFDDTNPQVIELGDETRPGVLPYQEQMNFMDAQNGF